MSHRYSTKISSLEEAARRICENRGGKWSGTKGMACCPAHDDRTPSLGVSLGQKANLASAWLLGADHHHGHDHDHHHHHHHAHADNNLRSAYFHVLADALTSVLAIVALLAGMYLGWAWMDAAMGLVGAFVIGRWSWSLLRDTAAVLVDAEAASERYTEVREALEDRDAAIGDLHIWRIGPGKYAVIASLIADDPLAPDNYASRLSEYAEYVHVTIEVHRCEHPHPELRAA